MHLYIYPTFPALRFLFYFEILSGFTLASDHVPPLLCVTCAWLLALHLIVVTCALLSQC